MGKISEGEWGMWFFIERHRQWILCCFEPSSLTSHLNATLAPPTHIPFNVRNSCIATAFLPFLPFSSRLCFLFAQFIKEFYLDKCFFISWLIEKLKLAVNSWRGMRRDGGEVRIFRQIENNRMENEWTESLPVASAACLLNRTSNVFISIWYCCFFTHQFPFSLSFFRKQ